MKGRPPGWRIDAGLVAVALIWGATFVLVKTALADISTLLFLTLRFTFASAALAVIFRKQLTARSARASIRGGVFAGLCLFSGYILQTFGLKYTTPGKAGFLTGLYIPLVPLMGSFVYRKAPQKSEMLGIVAAFAGMALMTVQSDLLKIGAGDLLILACAFAFACHILALGHFAKNSNSGALTMVQIGTGAVVGGLTCWWVEPAQAQWTPEVWIALAVTSLLATALAFYVQTWAQQYSSPTRTALIFSLEPVFAWIVSYFLTGEVLSMRGGLGAVLILSGILLVELKPSRIAEYP